MATNKVVRLVDKAKKDAIIDEPEKNSSNSNSVENVKKHFPDQI